MKHAFLLIAILVVTTTIGAQDKPSAQTLFNGKDLAGWKLRDPKRPVTWKIVSEASLDPADNKKLAGTGAGGTADGVLLRLPLPKGQEGTDLISEQEFGDAVVELEYMLAKDSNSGVFLQGQYEVQLTDSVGIADDKMQPGDHGGIPWTQKPLLNASGKLGEWQTCRIVFRAPRFDDKGKKTENARLLSVTLNGKKVQDNLELKEPTGSELDGGERAKGPLLLQGNEGIVAFRRLRVTPQ